MAAAVNSSKRDWIQGLDSLRFILAIIVVIGHLSPGQSIVSDGPVQSAIRGILGNTFVGVGAVIAFFIISGIVIHFPYRDGKQIDIKEFLLKRYIRVGIPMLAIVYLGDLLSLSISDFPFWSLYCELIYYTIYPFLLQFLRKYPDNRLLIPCILITGYFIVALDSTVITDLLTQQEDYNGNYWQHGVTLTWFLGLPSWLLGVNIAQNLTRQKKTSPKRIYAMRLLVLFAASICSFARFHLSLSYTISLNVFSLLAAYWIEEEIYFWRCTRPSVWLENAGKWSYSLYICHPLPWLVIPTLIKQASALSFLIQLGVALLFAYLFYLLVERPSHILAQKLSVKTPSFKLS